jgi:hypothetical protein
MHDTRRLVEAASALSAILRARGVPHAFYGDALISLLANQPHASVRSFVAVRQTFLTPCSPSKSHVSYKAGLHIHSAWFVTPSVAQKISQSLRRLGPIGAKQSCLRLVPCPHHHSSLQVTRKIPPFHSPNRSRSGNAYSPASTHSYSSFMMRSRSFLRGKRVHVALTQTRL